MNSPIHIAYCNDYWRQDGYIDVGDVCFRRNVLVTIIRCWGQLWPLLAPTSMIFTLAWGTFKRCHLNSVTSINKLSLTLSHQHQCHHIS